MIHSTTLRNNQATAFKDLVDGGSGAGKLKLRTGSTPGAGTLLVTFTLDDPSYGSPSTGVITANGFPKTVNAVATGTVGNYEITDSADTSIGSGASVGAGSGEVNLVSLSVTIGQPVTLNSLTYTVPAGT